MTGREICWCAWQMHCRWMMGLHCEMLLILMVNLRLMLIYLLLLEGIKNTKIRMKITIPFFRVFVSIINERIDFSVALYIFSFTRVTKSRSITEIIIVWLRSFSLATLNFHNNENGTGLSHDVVLFSACKRYNQLWVMELFIHKKFLKAQWESSFDVIFHFKGVKITPVNFYSFRCNFTTCMWKRTRLLQAFNIYDSTARLQLCAPLFFDRSLPRMKPPF